MPKVIIDVPTDLMPVKTEQPTASAMPRRRARGVSRYSRMNAAFGKFLVFIVIASAIPVASNRPVWWLIWGLLLGAAGIFYLARGYALSRGQRPLQISGFRLFFGVALIVPVYAIFQALPIADMLPHAIQTLPDRLPQAIWPRSLSVMPSASFLGAMRAITFLVFLMLVIEVGSQAERTHRLAMMLMVGLLLHAIFGLVALKFMDDYAIWGQKVAYRGALTGTFINRNSVATFLGFGLILAMALALQRGAGVAMARRDRGHATFLTPERLEITGLWLGVAVFALAILFTQSRMGAVATAAGAVVTYLVLRILHGTTKRRLLAEFAGGIFFIGVALLSTGGLDLVERSLFLGVDSATRLAIYRQTWGMVLDRPLTGFGYDAFAPAFELYRAEPLVAQNFVDLAHNTYLGLWAEQGLLVGSIPPLLLLWSAGMIVQRLRAGKGDTALNAAALGVLTLGGLHSTVDFSLEVPANVFCFLLIVGLAIARPRAAPETLPQDAGFAEPQAHPVPEATQ